MTQVHSYSQSFTWGFLKGTSAGEHLAGTDALRIHVSLQAKGYLNLPRAPCSRHEAAVQHPVRRHTMPAAQGMGFELSRNACLTPSFVAELLGEENKDLCSRSANGRPWMWNAG